MSPALVGAKKIGEFFLFMHHFDSVCVRERERDRRKGIGGGRVNIATWHEEIVIIEI